MVPDRHIQHHFPQALRQAREVLAVTQEAFDLISSRTYVSAVERGLKTPTLSKIDEFAGVLGIHPLTLLTLAYTVDASKPNSVMLLERVRLELESFEAGRQLGEPK